MVRLERNRTAALLIDVQQRLLPVIHNADELERRLGVLVDGIRLLGIPLLATEQYPKGLGPTIDSLVARIGDAAPVEKLSFSCCGVEGVDRFLAKVDPGTVLIAGMETHVCVLQTCLDLLERGITPVIVTDCVGSRHEHDHRFALERLAASGVVPTTVESALFELTGRAGTDEFRGISKLIRPL